MPSVRRKSMVHVGLWVERKLLQEFKQACQGENLAMSVVLRRAIHKQIVKCRKRKAAECSDKTNSGSMKK